MPTNDSIPCPNETTPERPRFFDGQLLTADDFSAEQDYHGAKRRAHNRYLHGSGIVCGLEVEASHPTSTGVVVQPGVAIDCCGREIRVIDPIVVDPRTLLEDQRKRGRIYLTLAYDESEAAPVPVPDGDGCDTSEQEASRIREIVRIGATHQGPDDPSAAASDCPGCEQPTVLLAALELSRRKRITAARIDSTVRRRVGDDPDQAATTRQVQRLQRQVTQLRLVVGIGAAMGLLGWWTSRLQRT